MKAQTDADLRDEIEAIHAEMPFYGHRRVMCFCLLNALDDFGCGVVTSRARLSVWS